MSKTLSCIHRHTFNYTLFSLYMKALPIEWNAPEQGKTSLRSPCTIFKKLLHIGSRLFFHFRIVLQGVLQGMEVREGSSTGREATQLHISV